MLDLDVSITFYQQLFHLLLASNFCTRTLDVTLYNETMLEAVLLVPSNVFKTNYCFVRFPMLKQYVKGYFFCLIYTTEQTNFDQK